MSALDMKLLVRGEKAQEIVVLWIKVHMDVCVPAVVVSVSARLSAHKNEHTYQYLVRLGSFLILSLPILSLGLHRAQLRATLRYTKRSKTYYSSSGFGQKCTQYYFSHIL